MGSLVVQIVLQGPPLWLDLLPHTVHSELLPHPSQVTFANTALIFNSQIGDVWPANREGIDSVIPCVQVTVIRQAG